MFPLTLYEKMEILLNKIGKEKKYAYIIGDKH